MSSDIEQENEEESMTPYEEEGEEGMTPEEEENDSSTPDKKRRSFENDGVELEDYKRNTNAEKCRRYRERKRERLNKLINNPSVEVYIADIAITYNQRQIQFLIQNIMNLYDILWQQGAIETTPDCYNIFKVFEIIKQYCFKTIHFQNKEIKPHQKIQPKRKTGNTLLDLFQNENLRFL
jgi:hypothetical protein